MNYSTRRMWEERLINLGLPQTNSTALELLTSHYVAFVMGEDANGDANELGKLVGDMYEFYNALIRDKLIILNEKEHKEISANLVLPAEFLEFVLTDNNYCWDTKSYIFNTRWGTISSLYPELIKHFPAKIRMDTQFIGDLDDE